MKIFSEVIRVEQGRVCNLEYHQERVNRTTKAFYAKDLDISSVKMGMPKEATTRLYKCRITYGEKIESVEYAQYARRRINSARVIEKDDIEYAYKSVERQHLNDLRAQSGCDEVIIVKNGMVTDASAFNIVLRKGDCYVTPKSYLLPGTMRQSLIDGGQVEERDVTMADLKEYDEVCFVNAMNNLDECERLPVAELV